MSTQVQTFTQDITGYLKPKRKEIFSRVIGLVQQHPPLKLLDIGCAAGDFLYQLSEVNPGIQTIGLDKSRALIKIAESRRRHAENPQFTHMNIISPTHHSKYQSLLKSHGEVVTILGTLHTFHDFRPILQPLISNPTTRKIIIHSPFNTDPINIKLFHQDITAKNSRYQSGFNIFSQLSISRFLQSYNIADFRFISFIMKKSLKRNPNQPLFNYHLIDSTGKKWLTNGAGLLMLEYLLEINLR